jgi:bacillithiol system protein YtxJ
MLILLPLYNMANFWNHLQSAQQLDEIIVASQEKPVLLFKHSTRCNISDAALNRIERKWTEAYTMVIKPYYLDLIAFRPLSNKVAEIFEIDHQSPQVLLIKNGKCVYHASHFDIQMDQILEMLN